MNRNPGSPQALLNIDYANLEQAWLRAAENVHEATAKELFGKVDPKGLRLAKIVNFNRFYGDNMRPFNGNFGVQQNPPKECGRADFPLNHRSEPNHMERAAERIVAEADRYHDESEHCGF